TTAPGTLDDLLGTVAWLPFVPAPAARRFDPVALQEDVARLRREYRRQGFLAAHVDYEVKTDENRRAVRVTIVVGEGRPLRLRSLKLAAADSARKIGTDEMQAEIATGWREVQKRHVGQRFSQKEVTTLQTGIENFFADRGFVRVTVEPRAAIDS